MSDCKTDESCAHQQNKSDSNKMEKLFVLDLLGIVVLVCTSHDQARTIAQSIDAVAIPNT